jgi:hypothetical protein
MNGKETRMTETDLLTSQEYARYRRCSLRTLDRERAEGRGCPYVRLGARVLYRRADIERYVEAHVRDHGAGVDSARPLEPQPRRRRGRPRKLTAEGGATSLDRWASKKIGPARRSTSDHEALASDAGTTSNTGQRKGGATADPNDRMASTPAKVRSKAGTTGEVK